MFDFIKLQFFPTSEGYVKPIYKKFTNNSVEPKYQYVYNYTDHLGNIRLQYSKVQGVLKVLEETHYYPFGLKHGSYNQSRLKLVRKLSNDAKTTKMVSVDRSYKYKYQGQELEEEFGKNTYAYQWRDYDPAIARFNKIDRFSEKYFDQSPYHFTKNNPILFTEVKGDSIRVGFRTGFLGIFGKKVTLTYDSKNKQWNGANGIKYTGKMNKFSNKVLSDLKKNQGNELGNEIVSNLSNDKLDHFVKRGDPNNNNNKTDNIYYNGSNSTDQKIFQGGKSGNSPGYVVLGHEMAHKYSRNLGVKNWRWFGSGAEIRGVDEYNAMYYENVLRGANNLPLRSAYSEKNGHLQGAILNSSSRLQRPPLLLIRRQTAPTMQAVHAVLIISQILNR